MPFHLRTVQPTKLCRLGTSDGQIPRDVSLSVFTSLQEVNVHSMVRIIHQLSNLSRHAEDIFTNIQGQAKTLGERSARLQRRLASLHQTVSQLDHRKVPVPVSNLDDESKWTVHYTASWHQQENVFLPSSRPACVEDLHKQAKVNLKTVLRECDKLRRDGYRSSQYYSQGPTFTSSTDMVYTNYQDDDDDEQSRKFSVSSSEEERLLIGKRPKTPLSHEFSDTQTNWTKSLPLPTPEEKMRQEAKAIHTDVVPINITGENFDRQANFRRSLIHTDTVVRRPKKVKRRKTITGVPDNIQKELASVGQIGFRGHSMHIPENYNALDDLEPCRSPSQRSETRDFSCQTEDIKIVPPSVRRIRAQRGQGIAALMSSSSGNMSSLSDPAGYTPRMNGDLNFRSLPRTGARVSIQSLEQTLDGSSHMQDTYITLPRQLCKLQVDESVVHLRNNPRTGTLQRPKSQEVRGSEREVFSNPACVVSPHAAYSTSIIPNAMLSSSSEVIAIHTSQSTGNLESKGISHCSSSHKKSVHREHVNLRDDHHSSSGNWSESSSARHSQTSDTLSPSAITIISLSDPAASLNNTNNMKNGSQPISYKRNDAFNSPSQDSDTRSDSSYSDGRQRNGSATSSINSADQWSSEMRENDSCAPLRKASSALSGSPISNMSTCSSDRKADSSSLYSVDHDGYYTSMHMDSGIDPGNPNHRNGLQNTRNSAINIVDMNEALNMEETSSYSDKSLTRSISLRKSKKAPPPPSRTDSLRRPNKKNLQSNGQVLNEKLIATLQQSLQLNLKSKSSGSPSQSPCSDYEDPWVLRSRSQSTVSASSSSMSATAHNMYSICPVTPSQSDTSSIKSEYADHWSYYIDEQPKSITHSPNKSANDYSARTVSQHIHTELAKQSSASPEKACRVTSPSSGYSSQSNTPTNLTPVPLLLRNMSPGSGKGKPKPKVPERRSSLISSVSISSSSTSLSSNTSDSVQQNVKKATLVLPSSPTPPLTPDPPPPPVMNVDDHGCMPPSPHFPPPPPETAMLQLTEDNLWVSRTKMNNCAPMTCPPPPPPLPIPHSKAPLIAPPLNTKALKNKTVPLAQVRQDGGNFNRPDLIRPSPPLVTAQALHMIQLRSVKKSSQLESEKITEQVLHPKRHDETSPVFSRPSLKPSASLDSRLSVSVIKNKNFNLPREKLQYSDSQSCSDTFTTDETTSLERREEEYQNSAYNGDKTVLSEMSSPEEKPSTLQSTPNASPNKKPPPVSKKPKLFLIVPPPQLDLAAEKIAQVNENVRSMPKPSERDSVSEHCKKVNDRIADENNSEEAAVVACQARVASLSPCKVEEMNTFFRQSPVLETSDHQKEDFWATMSEEALISDNKTERGNCDQKTSQEEETADVFETQDASSPRTDSIDGNGDVATPTRPRTTEDLFAAIHRSKRKVLGRKDSDDDRCRNHSPSPPVTPTGSFPNVSSFKQPGAIQRSIRKSSTSSDNFKALLLKKGSRSESGSRMSAAEMLKHTDPRFQRSQSDSSLDLPDSPTLTSPNKNRKAQEEWAKIEGLMPRSMSLCGPRYSRSRTPPSAASSKYNVRSRLQSSPMTVISEGEGETSDLLENSYAKAPLRCTMSVDRFQRTASSLNDSLGVDITSTKVHIDLMNRFMEVCPRKHNGSVEEKS
ncbi:NHS-like protein 1 isoform 1-T1 [Anomaloglossus baeobatrachus]|uniref:NHS-like protein 1 isoform X1 n=1 Tax=Anomaloglossus baeobatrachus TaxID=238106 RepID=UPI003F50C260